MKLKFHNDTDDTLESRNHFFPYPCIWLEGRFKDRFNGKSGDRSIFVCWLKWVICIDIIK